MSSPRRTSRPNSNALGMNCNRWTSWWRTRVPVRARARKTIGRVPAASAARPRSTCWDAAFKFVVERFQRDGDPSIIWEGHKAGRDIGYYQMEKLSNLDQLPPHGFDVSCFPIKIKHGSAGWVRAVAILND